MCPRLLPRQPPAIGIRRVDIAKQSTPYEKSRRRLAKTPARPTGGLKEFLNKNSLYREKLLRYRLLTDLYLASAGQSYKFDIIQGDVDEHGHDLVLVTGDESRHLQLKSKLSASKTARWRVSTKLLLPTSESLAATPLFPLESDFRGLGGSVILQEVHIDERRRQLLVGYRLANLVTIAASDKKVFLRLKDCAKTQRIYFELPIRVFMPPVDASTLIWLLQLPIAYSPAHLKGYDSRCVGPLAVLQAGKEEGDDYIVARQFRGFRKALEVTWQRRLNAWRKGKI